MARVTVSVNVRDMTRGDLVRMRHNFRSLGEDLTNAVGNRSRENFTRLSQSVNTARRDLGRLRGVIPDAEFFRLDDAIQRSQRTLQRGFSNVGDRAFARVAQRVQEVVDGFQELDRSGGIRLRVDTSALARADSLLERWRTQQNRREQVVIRPRVDTDHTNRQLLRWFSGPLRGLMGMVGGTLSDGIGQGLVGAFRSPTFGAIIVAALMAALSVVGAALAGVLVMAIGGAFVGLGGFIAARSKEVTAAWKKELDQLKPLFKEAAEPMIPVLEHATRVMGGMGKEFAPKFKEAMEQVGPTMNGFIDRTKEGFRKLGQGAWDDLQQAFRTFMTAFGPEWEGFLEELGKSLGALARTVNEHSGEIAIALRAVLGVINILIDTVNFFANAWVMGVELAIASTARLLEILGGLMNGFLGMIETMIGGLAIFADMLGMGDEVREAQEAFGRLRDDTVSKFTDMSSQVKQWGADMDHANRERVLQVNIDSWNNQLRIAKEELKSVPPEKQTELRGKIDDLKNKISAAEGQLASMQKDYYVRIHAYKVGDWAIGGGGPGQAHGGITGNWGRAATGGARSNMTLVGEQGPEFVDLAPGSHVRSNADSRRLMSQGMGQQGQGPLTLIIKSNGNRASDLLLEMLRDAIHDAGGDPVRVLGG